ncbi:uncharacterized protein E0L32_010918 [Thyridium curvatum]|uniref:Origin recognition complex subunit 2 n=1 Tax=Thyridium curvatum TaxID=1093900 RepID=A0A507AJR2_9PEZI|nr:uncharacterized protein E0L32_010918 [Thyridium curvatum]TPX07117.1 hypothetical protein E0L32_010918 [Thyridium curvatum]
MARLKRRKEDEDAANGPGEAEDRPELTPSKRRRTSKAATDTTANANGGEKPTTNGIEMTPRKRGRPRKDASQTPGSAAGTPAKSPRKGGLFQTPVKTNGFNGHGTHSRRTGGADRSARRKSARALIDRVVAGDISDEEAGDEGVAREIYESSDDEEEDDLDDAEQVLQAEIQVGAEAPTPSKRPRGRPKGSKNRPRTPTPPPQDLPAHELYFFQNKPGLAKTSANNLSSLNLLSHDEYFSILRDKKVTEHHREDVEFLQSLHAQSFPQWEFELDQGFSVCLYGYGSKRPLLHRFASHLFDRIHDQGAAKQHKIVIINGYVRTISIREILTILARAVDPAHRLPTSNPVTMLQNLLSLLSSAGEDGGSSSTTTTKKLTLVLNSLDAAPLRKAAAQSVLAQLAAHPRIRLVCSADTPDFPLLWDSSLRSALGLAFHDCTTFAPFGAELDVVDDVHELLGRNTRRVGGKDGVAFVLRSLPENAKNLFRLLVGEVLVAMDEGGDAGGGMFGGGGGGEGPGVEYRMLYNKAVEEFICSSEMAFRTLLKE